MTGKELIKEAFALKEPERIPWIPFVGCHGGNLIKKKADEYLKSSDLMIRGLSKAIELYNPDGIPVAFDLQIEAEALGCKLQWADKNPPAVISHVLSEKSISDLKIPSQKDARIPVVLEVATTIRKNYPDIALYGLITGPFTLALHLLGTDIFLKMYESPDEINELLEFTKEVAKAMACYYIDAGCDVIAVVDPMTSQIDTGSFETFISEPETEVFELIRSKNVLSSFFVCGHAQHNIELMCACKPDNVSIDENIPLEYVRDIALKNKISFGGNMKLTVVLLMGSVDDVYQEVIECLDRGGKKGYILAPGCDLPMNTPQENLMAVKNLLHDPYQQDVVRTLEKQENVRELLNMKDYGITDKVIVDVITLDSESCAPCQYMVEAVKQIAPHFEGIVEWREHAIKEMDSVTFMNSLMVKNIPTICIDGKITFVSKIPPKNELINAIQKRINEKLRLKISSKRARIYVIGKSQKEFEQIKEHINLAIKETGRELEVKYTTDKEMQLSFGVSVTPAIVIADYKLKSQGEIPKVEIIREWIKELD